MQSRLDCVSPRIVSPGTAVCSLPVPAGQVLQVTATKSASEPSTQYLGRPAGASLPLSAKVEPITTAVVGVEQEPTNKIRGTVKFFSFKSGFGFITSAKYQQDIFVHRSAIVAGNPCHRRCSLRDNEVVDFLVVYGAKGPKAVEVTGPGGSAVLGSLYAPEQLRKDGSRGRKRHRARRRHRAVQQQKEVQAIRAPLPSPDGQQESLSVSPLTAEPTVEAALEHSTGDNSVSYGTVSAIGLQVERQSNDTLLSSSPAAEYQTTPAVEYLSSPAVDYQTTPAMEYLTSPSEEYLLRSTYRHPIQSIGKQSSHAAGVPRLGMF